MKTTTYPKRAATKAVFRGKIISLKVYDIKEETFKINYLSFHLKKLKKKKVNKLNLGLLWWRSG